ncbi:hypothetical protein Nhal_1125 [Nitrosococcus halophilus Nc 4]|uniref:Uncharacterized protein n=1 Tax=Nitrosococcus halophilus (strain Nc4) TaxID=472759 RepID=D5BZJ9_NITHN|nr:hypothetical protein [Nitrosococcus halophilus]ADE14294.1 hypothetical protein Nhal_1125 [Nitrosococcus halophilus Nc 4]
MSTKTRNERIQRLLSEGLSEARQRNMHAMKESYCAVHLANKCATLQEQQSRLVPYQEARKLQQWMRENPALVYGVLGDLSVEQLANLAEIPTLFGSYILGQLHEAMVDEEEMQDKEPDREAEHDLRERINGYRPDMLGVC